ncbi:MAG: MFS transporter [Thiotrichales bacterium]|nr:MFS transporter [Thiotrichales bacterium]
MARTFNRLGHRNAFFYGWMGFPTALLGIPLYLYLPNFYHQTLGISLTVIGSALLAARLLDVVTDPLIGWYSDRFQNRMPRPWQIAMGAILLLVGTYQLFFPNQNFDFYSLIFWSFLTYLGWTLVQVPHQAMQAEISTQSTLKTLLAGYREAFAIAGVLAIVLLPALLGYLPTENAFYTLSFSLLAISLPLAVLFLWAIQPEDNMPKAAEPKTAESAWRALIRLWQQERQVFAIMPSYFINNFANALPATIFILFVGNYLQLEAQIGLFLVAYFLSGILALPGWIWLARHFGKHQTWQASMLLACVTFSGVFWLDPGNWQGFLLICILTGLSLGVDVAMPTSIQADLSQQLRHSSNRHAGLLFGLWGMLTKFALALAVGLSFPLLDWVQNAQWSTQYLLLFLYAGLPIALKLLAWYLLRRHRLNFVPYSPSSL